MVSEPPITPIEAVQTFRRIRVFRVIRGFLSSSIIRVNPRDPWLLCSAANFRDFVWRAGGVEHDAGHFY
jgi:hypothetical protein